MGKAWDYDVPQVDVWREVLRVLKPGGHLLAFAGTRTQHRMAVQIEDAGFEIRDLIAWVYGSGFPKSLDVSKAIDKAAGLERDRIPGGQGGANNILGARKCGEAISGEAISGEAQQWAGWGTALKPALEPITVARKPLTGTVAANVLEHGTGAINVNGCRVGSEARPLMVRTETVVAATSMSGTSTGATSSGELTTQGRWPANLIHDGSDEPCAPLGDAARFFYCAKASKADRGEGNGHPTVKPTELMRYLCRLVTPPGGVVLDPFMGSGSTGKAAALEGFQFIGIEREAEYLEIARQRVQALSLQGAFL
jgi:site-specific DNA-methyltransferase (adenine-specific)